MNLIVAYYITNEQKTHMRTSPKLSFVPGPDLLTSYTANPMVSRSRPSFLSFRLFFCIRAMTTLHTSSSSSASSSCSLNCGLVQNVSADQRRGVLETAVECYEPFTYCNNKGCDWCVRICWSNRCSSCSLLQWSHGSTVPRKRWPPSGALCCRSGRPGSCCRSPLCRSSSWSLQIPSWRDERQWMSRYRPFKSSSLVYLSLCVRVLSLLVPSLLLRRPCNSDSTCNYCLTAKTNLWTTFSSQRLFNEHSPEFTVVCWVLQDACFLRFVDVRPLSGAVTERRKLIMHQSGRDKNISS